MRIDPLTHETAPYVVALCQELLELGQFHDIPFDWEHTLGRVLYALRLPTEYISLCAPDHGGYTGFVSGYVEPFAFSPRLMATERAWYVRPNTPERTRMGLALMKGFMKWAIDDMGALMVQSGDVMHINSTAVFSAYRSLGFKRFGTLFKYVKEPAYVD